MRARPSLVPGRDVWRAAWHELWRPGSQPALDGWRALAIGWVLAFHGLFYLRPFVSDGAIWELSRRPGLYLLWEGDFGVDIFFVLSGLLIGRGLVVERERTGRLRLARFYGRRALRLLPAYYVALGLTALAIPDNRDNVWANLVYMNNLLPFADQFMAWSWSLAIEEQFYLGFPWLLLAVYRLPARARGWAFATVAVATVPLSAWLAHRAGLVVTDLVMLPMQPLDRWVLNFDVLYDKPWTRGSALLAGVLIAWLRERPHVRARMARRPGLEILALALSPIALGWSLRLWPGVYGLGEPASVAYLASYRLVFAAAIAALMAISIGRGPVGRRLGRWAGWRGWTPLARLAYTAYLVNPVVTLALWRRIEPGPWATSWWLLPAVLGTVLATVVAAFLLFALVEQPLMRYRNRHLPGPSART